MSDRMFTLFRELVERARSQCPNPDSAPAVQTVLTAHFLAEITKPPLLTYVLVNGINPLLRRVLKSISVAASDDDRQRMLGQWPTTAMRELVAEVGHSMVFVPSRAEFVELVPDALTRRETLEAGKYLVNQGQDTTRRGRLLLRLAKLRTDGADEDAPAAEGTAAEPVVPIA